MTGTFAHDHRLDALRESLGLAYPSWILALAMGAGKTVLVGAIIATEFAMGHGSGPRATSGCRTTSPSAS